MIILVALGRMLHTFPFHVNFNDNETLASYANGIYDYYDVERIEEFVFLRVLMKLNLCF